MYELETPHTYFFSFQIKKMTKKSTNKKRYHTAAP